MPRKKVTPKPTETTPDEPRLERYKKIHRSRKDLMINNFLGGIMWGLGSVIGATIVVTVLGIIIVQTRRLPLIGDVVEVAVDSVLKAEPIQELEGTGDSVE